MKRRRASRVSAATLLLCLVTALPHLPAAAAELSRPAFYADAWGGIHLGWPENGAWPAEQGMAAGMAAGVYADLGQKTSAALRFAYWETWDEATFSRRYTTLDALWGPHWGGLRLLAGLSVLDRRDHYADYIGEQSGGWGWRLGLAGERAFRRVVVGGGVYATPYLSLRQWWEGSEREALPATLWEQEVYLVLPLGGAWALRGGGRGFQAGLGSGAARRWETGGGVFLGAAARF